MSNKPIPQIRNLSIMRVTFEPGDQTRYDFLLAMDGDDYIISPYGSTLSFPQRISTHTIPPYDCLYAWDGTVGENPTNQAIDYYAKRYNCNPWTVVAVMKAILYLENLKK